MLKQHICFLQPLKELYGICTMAAMPLQKENLHASEMVSQLLYNETYETTDNDGDWIRIRTTFDHYEGWIPAIQHHKIDTSAFEAMQHTKYVIRQAVATCNGNLPSTPVGAP